MAEKTANLPDPPSKSQQPRPLKRWLIVGAALAMLAVAGFFGFQKFRSVQERRVIGRAQAFLDQNDAAQAVVSLRRALQINPRDIAANRLMAELAEKSGSRQAIFWRRTVTDLEPSLANRLAWARTCVRFGEAVVGEQALADVNEAEKKSAAYLHMTGCVAEALNQADKAETSFAEAVRLEPGNEQYQLDLATVRLLAGDTEARVTLERLEENPTLGRSARRALCQDAIKKGDAPTALQIAWHLQKAPDGPYEDNLLYLSLLRQFHRPEFDDYLLRLQEASQSNPNYLALLIGWLNRNELALLAVDWAKRLPQEICKQNPVPAALAESYANLRNWAEVRTLVEAGHWQDLEFMRIALLARVLREEGDLPGSKSQWINAVKAAGDAPEGLAKLALFATASKWQDEATALLWSVAKGKTNPQWALASLWRDGSAAHNARALLKVASRVLEIHPNEARAQHDVAMLTFLLNSSSDAQSNADIEHAQLLASEAYKATGNNPGFTATYAYSLYFKGKTDEALTLMRSIPDKLLENSVSAIFYAVVLADGGHLEDAAKYLEIAQRQSLLPEERDLIAKTRSVLARRATAAELSR